MRPEFASGMPASAFLHAKKVRIGPAIGHYAQLITIHCDASKFLSLFGQELVLVCTMRRPTFVLFEGADGEIERTESVAAARWRTAHWFDRLDAQVLAECHDTPREGT